MLTATSTAIGPPAPTQLDPQRAQSRAAPCSGHWRRWRSPARRCLSVCHARRLPQTALSPGRTTAQVAEPCEEVPPELPEPTLGINFARDGAWLLLLLLQVRGPAQRADGSCCWAADAIRCAPSGTHAATPHCLPLAALILHAHGCRAMLPLPHTAAGMRKEDWLCLVAVHADCWLVRRCLPSGCLWAYGLVAGGRAADGVTGSVSLLVLVVSFAACGRRMQADRTSDPACVRAVSQTAWPRKWPRPLASIAGPPRCGCWSARPPGAQPAAHTVLPCPSPTCSDGHHLLQRGQIGPEGAAAAV